MIGSTHDLTPRYENVKSYYGKAYYISSKKERVLYSYNIPVAEISYIIKDGKRVEILTITNNDNHLTSTTLRHIKEFLKQNDFIADTKKQILKDYKRGALSWLRS